MPKNARKFLKVSAKNCSGCRLCELVCSERHTPGWINPKEARIQVEVEHRHNRNRPRVCIQCQEHPCLEACPEGAMKLHPTLALPVVDAEACTGCRACQEACPYGLMFFDEIHRKALKCDLCGGDPECVKSCLVKAISYSAE